MRSRMSIAQCPPYFLFTQAFKAQPGRRLLALSTVGFWRQIARHKGDGTRGSRFALMCPYYLEQSFGRSAKIVDMCQRDPRLEYVLDPSPLGYFLPLPTPNGESAQVPATL